MENTKMIQETKKEAIHFHPGLILLIIIFSQLLSCKPEPLDVNMPQAPEKPAIAAQYGIDGIMGLVLSRTFDAGKQIYSADSNGIYYDSILLLSGAEVEITGEGRRFVMEELDPGIYASSEAFFEDRALYTLQIKCKDGKSISAQSRKMPKVSFNNVSISLNENNKLVKINYSFNDIVDAESYYVVNYISGNQQQKIPEKPDPEFIAKRILEQNASYDLIDEKMFKEGVFTGEKTINRPVNSDSIGVALTHISKDYYHYLQAQKKAGTLFNQIRAEVINFPSNIKNGYGFFELNEPDFRILELQ